MIAPTALELSPLLTTAITAQPRTGDRAVRGAELLRTGKVQRLADDVRGADHWLVYGSAAHPPHSNTTTPTVPAASAPPARRRNHRTASAPARPEHAQSPRTSRTPRLPSADNPCKRTSAARSLPTAAPL